MTGLAVQAEGYRLSVSVGSPAVEENGTEMIFFQRKLPQMAKAKNRNQKKAQAELIIVSLVLLNLKKQTTKTVFLL